MPEIPCGTPTLQTLLEEAYAVTYRGSSLKVRRRYRKLICHFERRSQQGQIIGQARHDGTDDEIDMACRARSRAHKPA